MADYVPEIHHAGERIVRLEKALDDAIARAPEQIRCVMAALQAWRRTEDGTHDCRRNGPLLSKLNRNRSGPLG